MAPHESSEGADTPSDKPKNALERQLDEQVAVAKKVSFVGEEIEVFNALNSSAARNSFALLSNTPLPFV